MRYFVKAHTLLYEGAQARIFTKERTTFVCDVVVDATSTFTCPRGAADWQLRGYLPFIGMGG